MSHIDIIIPIRNESENIQELVKRIDVSLQASNISYKIIFVDFHSDDGSDILITQLLSSFPLEFYSQKSKGKAMAVIEGVEYATSDYVVMIDADLQYPPEAILEMYRLVGKYDVVVARREVNNEKFLRKFLSKIHSFVFGRLLFGLSCDVQSGLKLFPKSLIDDIDTSDITPWTLDLSLLLAARRRGYRIGEEPIAFEERRFGKSKVSVFQSMYEHVYTSIRMKLKYCGK